MKRNEWHEFSTILKRSAPPPGDPSASVGADDAGHRVPAGPRAAVGEMHRAGAHIRRELLRV